ncbi:MAG: hypothetical protein VYE46_08480 [Cyanobacteriota bacterium]|nr:hypothetical protein [Cyanobacteriota bacterium]
MLCNQVRGQSFGIVKPNDHLSLYGLSIAPTELLDNGSVAVTRRATATDGVLDYYLHALGGAVKVSGGGFGEQEIQSMAIPGPDQDYFNAMVRRLDSVIDLDFTQVVNPLSADVDLYYDAEIDSGGGGITLGLATMSVVGGWELYLNYPALDNDDPYRRYALIHEFGHSLGLEHPFEARDGDVFNGSTDPWSSAYPEDTVMAYRSPRSESWPEFFSDNDLNALIEVWGAEARYLSENGDVVVGNAYRDVLLGDAGDDELRGLSKSDLLNGGLGDDRLFGGPGSDQIFGGSGSDVIHGGWGHDEIRPGSGDDRMRGGYGSDLFVIGSGYDVIEDFRVADNDKIGIRDNMDYSIAQAGNNLLISTEIGNIILYGVDKSSFNAAMLIVDV